MRSYPWRSVRKAREQLSETLRDYPNIIGSMLGIRVRRGEIFPEPVVTILVSRKPSKKLLSRSDRLPRRLRVGKRWIATDVVRVASMVAQDHRFAGTWPLGLHDEFRPATISAFCRANAHVFGMSCGHALMGPDQNPFTPANVSLFSPILSDWVPVGSSTILLNSPGPGIPGDFGFLDAGLFEIVDSDLRQGLMALPPVPRVARANHGQVLTARSRRAVLRGTVIGHEQLNLAGSRSDVIIRVEPPGTIPGDSGILWCNSQGVPLAIHCLGERKTTGSLYTVSMHLDRALSRLNVTMIGH